VQEQNGTNLMFDILLVIQAVAYCKYADVFFYIRCFSIKRGGSMVSHSFPFTKIVMQVQRNKSLWHNLLAAYSICGC